MDPFTVGMALAIIPFLTQRILPSTESESVERRDRPPKPYERPHCGECDGKMRHVETDSVDFGTPYIATRSRFECEECAHTGEYRQTAGGAHLSTGLTWRS